VATPEVLTIAEAAKEMNLSEQRIHQLLAGGDLDGVELPVGRNRHTPGAPRVFARSVERLRRRRTDEKRQKAAARDAARARRQPTGTPPPTPATPSGSLGVHAEGEVEAARAAALEMKVRFDAARDQLRAERARTRRALDIAAGLLDLLRDSTKAADDVDELAGGYADALTQALAPHTPPEH
jgi:hypothetical protein